MEKTEKTAAGAATAAQQQQQQPATCRVCLEPCDRHSLRRAERLCDANCAGATKYAYCASCIAQYASNLVRSTPALAPMKCLSPGCNRVLRQEKWKPYADEETWNLVQRRAADALSLFCGTCHLRGSLLNTTVTETGDEGLVAAATLLVRRHRVDKATACRVAAVLRRFCRGVVDRNIAAQTMIGELLHALGSPPVATTAAVPTLTPELLQPPPPLVRAGGGSGPSAASAAVALPSDTAAAGAATPPAVDATQALALFLASPAEVRAKVGGAAHAIVAMVADLERQASLQTRLLHIAPAVRSRCCRTLHCFSCKTFGTHRGQTCEQQRLAARQAGRDDGIGAAEVIVPCPGCGVPLVKGDGCNIVRCICLHEFPFAQAVAYNQISRFDRFVLRHVPAAPAPADVANMVPARDLRAAGGRNRLAAAPGAASPRPLAPDAVVAAAAARAGPANHQQQQVSTDVRAMPVAAAVVEALYRFDGSRHDSDDVEAAAAWAADPANKANLRIAEAKLVTKEWGPALAPQVVLNAVEAAGVDLMPLLLSVLSAVKAAAMPQAAPRLTDNTVLRFYWSYMPLPQPSAESLAAMEAAMARGAISQPLVSWAALAAPALWAEWKARRRCRAAAWQAAQGGDAAAATAAAAASIIGLLPLPASGAAAPSAAAAQLAAYCREHVLEVLAELPLLEDRLAAAWVATTGGGCAATSASVAAAARAAAASVLPRHIQYASTTAAPWKRFGELQGTESDATAASLAPFNVARRGIIHAYLTGMPPEAASPLSARTIAVWIARGEEEMATMTLQQRQLMEGLRDYHLENLASRLLQISATAPEQMRLATASLKCSAAMAPLVTAFARRHSEEFAAAVEAERVAVAERIAAAERHAARKARAVAGGMETWSFADGKAIAVLEPGRPCCKKHGDRARRALAGVGGGGQPQRAAAAAAAAASGSSSADASVEEPAQARTRVQQQARERAREEFLSRSAVRQRLRARQQQEAEARENARRREEDFQDIVRQLREQAAGGDAAAARFLSEAGLDGAAVAGAAAAADEDNVNLPIVAAAGAAAVPVAAVAAVLPPPPQAAERLQQGQRQLPPPPPPPPAAAAAEAVEEQPESLIVSPQRPIAETVAGSMPDALAAWGRLLSVLDVEDAVLSPAVAVSLVFNCLTTPRSSGQAAAAGAGEAATVGETAAAAMEALARLPGDVSNVIRGRVAELPRRLRRDGRGSLFHLANTMDPLGANFAGGGGSSRNFALYCVGAGLGLSAQPARRGDIGLRRRDRVGSGHRSGAEARAQGFRLQAICLMDRLHERQRQQRQLAVDNYSGMVIHSGGEVPLVLRHSEHRAMWAVLALTVLRMQPLLRGMAQVLALEENAGGSGGGGHVQVSGAGGDGGSGSSGGELSGLAARLAPVVGDAAAEQAAEVAQANVMSVRRLAAWGVAMADVIGGTT